MELIKGGKYKIVASENNISTWGYPGDVKLRSGKIVILPNILPNISKEKGNSVFVHLESDPDKRRFLIAISCLAPFTTKKETYISPFSGKAV